MKKSLPRQHGAVAPVMALMLPVLIGSAAFAIDLAYVHVVRNELQNDADAAALAGAPALVDASSGVVRWADATAQAQQSGALNQAAGQRLSDAQVQTGYWNLTGKPSGLQSPSLVPTVWDAPAVAVTVRKAAGQNQGAVPTFFWATSALALVLFPIVSFVALWIYSLIFVFAALWFSYFLLDALKQLRAEELDEALTVQSRVVDLELPYHE